MVIKNIIWRENDIAHIARHGVEPLEVEEVCFRSSPLIWKAKYNRYAALGKTRNGRYLTIIFEYTRHNKATIVTARAMSESERRLYQRR